MRYNGEHTQTWQKAHHFSLPRIVYANKMIHLSRIYVYTSGNLECLIYFILNSSCSQKVRELSASKPVSLHGLRHVS